MGPSQAAALVRARLGRPAQDALEAAVVLEAWGGVRPAVALRLGQQIKMAETEQPPSSPGREERRATRWRLSEQLALVVALVALLAWSGPLIGAYGPRVFELTWKIAVPLTLGIQYAVRRRYLAGVEGLGRLRPDGRGLLVAAVLLPPLLTLAAGTGGALAGLMVLLWVTASIVGRRGWGLWHALLLVGLAEGLWRGAPALPVLIVSAVAALVMATGAVRTSESSARRPGAWRPVLVNASIGIGLGLVIVLDGGVHWDTEGPLPALLLLPSVLAGLWAGSYLDRLWDVLTTALRDTSLRSVAQRRVRRSATRVVVTAFVGLIALAALMSLFVGLTPWAAGAPQPLLTGLLTGYGTIAVATLAVTLTESFGRPAWALAAVVLALAAEASLRWGTGTPLAGAGLVVAGAVTVIVTLPSVAAFLRQPARTLATVVHVQ